MMLPLVASVRRVSIMPIVVLPEPDSPTTPSVRPFCSEKSDVFTASITLRRNRPSFRRYALDKPFTSISAGPLTGAASRCSVLMGRS